MSEVSSEPVSSEPITSQIETPVVEAPVKKKYSYKSDGVDHSEELSDEEISSKLSLAKAANKRMSEAAQSKKQVEQFVHALQNDPESVLLNENFMGVKKFRDLAEKFILKQIEQESLSPEERAQAEKERKLSAYEAKEKEEMTKQEQAQAIQLEEQYTREYEKVIIDSLTGSNLPKTPYTIKRMAALMQTNLKNGYDLTPSQLASMVKEDYAKEYKTNTAALTAEQFIEMYGQEMADKLRKHDLAKFKLSKQAPTPPTTPSPQEGQSRRMSSRDYTESLKAKFSR